jgi:hypothetical protein
MQRNRQSKVSDVEEHTHNGDTSDSDDEWTEDYWLRRPVTRPEQRSPIQVPARPPMIQRDTIRVPVREEERQPANGYLPDTVPVPVMEEQRQPENEHLDDRYEPEPENEEHQT